MFRWIFTNSQYISLNRAEQLRHSVTYILHLIKLNTYFKEICEEISNYLVRLDKFGTRKSKKAINFNLRNLVVTNNWYYWSDMAIIWNESDSEEVWWCCIDSFAWLIFHESFNNVASWRVWRGVHITIWKVHSVQYSLLLIDLLFHFHTLTVAVAAVLNDIDSWILDERGEKENVWYQMGQVLCFVEGYPLAKVSECKRQIRIQCVRIFQVLIIGYVYMEWKRNYERLQKYMPNSHKLTE